MKHINFCLFWGAMPGSDANPLVPGTDTVSCKLVSYIKTSAGQRCQIGRRKYRKYDHVHFSCLVANSVNFYNL